MEGSPVAGTRPLSPRPGAEADGRPVIRSGPGLLPPPPHGTIAMHDGIFTGAGSPTAVSLPVSRSI